MLRDIVMHALGISKESHRAAGILGKGIRSVEESCTSKEGSADNSHEPRGESSPDHESVRRSHNLKIESSPTGKTGHSSKHAPTTNPSHEKQRKPHNTTPSPNSRLSSGFGSLHDVETSTPYDLSYNQELPREDTQIQSPPNTHHPSYRTPPPPLQTGTPPLQVRGGTQESRMPQHSHPQPYPQSQTSNTPPRHHYSTNSRQSLPHNDRNHKERGSWTGQRGTGATPQQRSRIGNAVASPSGEADFQSPSSSSHQVPVYLQSPRGHKGTSPTSSPFDESYSPRKPLSTREQQALQQLEVKQVHLQRSKHEEQQLSTNVQLLSLRVKEEDLRYVCRV